VVIQLGDAEPIALLLASIGHVAHARDFLGPHRPRVEDQITQQSRALLFQNLVGVLAVRRVDQPAALLVAKPRGQGIAAEQPLGVTVRRDDVARKLLDLRQQLLAARVVTLKLKMYFCSSEDETLSPGAEHQSVSLSGSLLVKSVFLFLRPSKSV
jgi:hypothetical protein